MDGTDETRNPIDNEGCCACSKGEEREREEGGTCHVLMHSQAYGTEVWPCANVDEAIHTLARLARSAEERRRSDGIQRFFCLWGEPPVQGQEAACDPASPDAPDSDALTLTIHFRETRHGQEPEARNGLRRADETWKEVVA